MIAPATAPTVVQRLEAFERGELTADEWRSFRLLNGV